MKYSASLDAPIARRAMEKVLCPSNIWFLVIMILLNGCLCIAGMIGGGLNSLDQVKLPDSTGMMFLGIGGFAFFFPWLLCFYYSRILLRAICDLEQKVEKMNHET